MKRKFKIGDKVKYKDYICRIVAYRSDNELIYIIKGYPNGYSGNIFPVLEDGSPYISNGENDHAYAYESELTLMERSTIGYLKESQDNTTNEYNVKQEDLIEDIKDFPIEVVQKMVEKQVEQGNTPNVSVFQRERTSNEYGDGFDWDKTTEENDFWSKVIIHKDFSIFFEKYPKSSKSSSIKDNKIKLNSKTKLILNFKL